MFSLEEARARILAVIEPLSAENAALASALGRVLAEDVISPIDLPAFDNSAMDGYAVRAAEVAGATPESPIALDLAGQVAAGGMLAGDIPKRSCVRVFTGSALPAGTDAVIMQEETRPAAGRAGKRAQVLFLDGAKLGENVRRSGEDVRRGARVGAAGECLNAVRLALLAAVGIVEVRVRRQPVVSLLATGSELIEPGQARPPGSIYESNRTMLASLVAAAGGVARIFPIVPDSLEETTRALQHAFADADAVITSGGVSVGELDFVKRAFSELGGALEFWRVAVKPGKPFVFGRWREKFLFGLPGNPVSAFVTFLMLVRPSLLRWQGMQEVELGSHPCVLAEALVNRGDRRHFMRVQVDAQGRARPAGGQGSHLLGGLSQANGLVDVAPETVLPPGITVPVIRWNE